MGKRTAAKIRDRLLAEGMLEDTPIAVVSGLCRAGEARWTGALLDIELGMAAINSDEPVLIGVGDVFGAVAKQAGTVDSFSADGHRMAGLR